ncbi:MAG: exonuclease SbcCD subunit D [Candidatus Methanoperedens sp.]|nr:exonuclease SbcCD subunit D [Candidatus Methanoperedens sp.]
MNFIHTSDLHLGYAQYGLEERFRDYARAFQSVIKYAIDHKAEFILISGDLFHKRNINAPTYFQAYKVLKELKEKSPYTQVYAIEGNHDLAFHADRNSWLEILNSQGLLRLIRIKEAGELKLMGDHVELDNIRIFGVRYIGANTTSSILRIYDEIKKIEYERGKKFTILMMHFGLEGQVKQSEAGEIPYSSLMPLKEVVDYLALGHYHMQYEMGGWIFNPGSIEMISMNEYGLPKGFYHVKDSGAKLITPVTRSIRRIKLDISGIETPEALYLSIGNILERQPATLSDNKPLVELLLYGELIFPKSDIDIDMIKKMLDVEFLPLSSEVKIEKSNSQYTVNEGDIRGLSREQIELRVFSERVKLNARYRDDADAIVNTMIEVKKKAAAGIEEAEIRTDLRWCFEKLCSPAPGTFENGGKKEATQQTLLSSMKGDLC